MKLLLLVICLLIEINYSLSVLESFVKQAKQTDFIDKLINQKNIAKVESKKNRKIIKNNLTVFLISDFIKIYWSMNHEQFIFWRIF